MSPFFYDNRINNQVKKNLTILKYTGAETLWQHY